MSELISVCYGSEQREIVNRVCAKKSIISRKLTSLQATNLNTTLVDLVVLRLDMRSTVAVEVTHICPKTSRPTHGSWCKIVK